MVEFIRDGIRSGRTGAREALETAAAIARFQLGAIGFSAFVAGTSASLRGVEEAEFAAIGERIFRERLAGTVYPESRALVEAHLDRKSTRLNSSHIQKSRMPSSA